MCYYAQCVSEHHILRESVIRFGTVSLEDPPSRIEFDDGRQRLILKTAVIEDAAGIHEAVQESLTELRQFFAWAHKPMTVEDHRIRLEELFGKDSESGEVLYLVRDVEEGPILGSISYIRQRVLNPYAAELGYWIRSSSTGCGLGTLAARCLCVVALDYCACTRMQCIYDEKNLASQRVAEKSGFQQEALLKRYGVVATPETRQKGDITSENSVMSALFPEDLGRFSWYEGIQENLRVFDSEGNRARPNPGKVAF